MNGEQLSRGNRVSPFVAAGAASAWLLLPGCTNLTDETFKLENVQIGQRSSSGQLVDTKESVPGLAVDAKSRFIWAPTRPVRVMLPGADDRDGVETRHVAEQQILCAEPSPDAMVTFSTALSTAIRGELAGQGSASGELSRSLAETGRVLGERTPTIQLLRDNLYRACESYANGVVDNFGYALILNKIDDTMVTLVAIEALGRGTLKEGDSELVTGAITAEEELKTAGQLVGEADARLMAANSRVTSLTEQATRLSADKARADSAKTIAAAETTASSEASIKLPGAKEKSSAFGAQITTKKGEIAAQQTILDDSGRANEHAQARSVITQREAEIRGLEDQKAEQDREIVRLEGLAARAGSSNTQQTAAAEEAAALGERLNAINTQLSAANTERAAAETAAASARSGHLTAQGKAEAARRQAGTVRPELGELERNQIERIVQREQNDSNPSTMIGACMIWFAQHPDYRGTGQVGFAPSSVPPAIARYCEQFLTMAKAKTDAEIAVAKAKAEAELRRARTVSLVPADFLDPDVEPDEFQDAVWMPAADGAVE